MYMKRLSCVITFAFVEAVLIVFQILNKWNKNMIVVMPEGYTRTLKTALFHNMTHVKGSQYEDILAFDFQM